MLTTTHTTDAGRYGGGVARTVSLEDLRIDRADLIANLAVARQIGDDAGATYWISEIKSITEKIDALEVL